MRLWTWFRTRRRGWQIAIVLGLLPVFLPLGYVAVRSFLFAVAEKEAGLYLPAGADLIVRARDLERHWQRIQRTGAWRVLRRRILKDPFVRGLMNDALKDADLPTLDDFEDERKEASGAESLILRGAGRDAVLAVQVGDSWARARWFAATRLRWSDYLLVPFGSLVLPSEKVAGRSALTLRGGQGDIYVAFAGALALASNDRNLLGKALERTGEASTGNRPLAFRVEFERSRALQEIRRTAQGVGFLPELKLETARAFEGSIDVDQSAAFADFTLPGVEGLHDGLAPPAELSRLAPEASSGTLMTNTGFGDLHDRLSRWCASAGPGDYMARNAKEALETLDDGGLSRLFLPLVEPGLAVLTGVEEREGRVYPAVAILMPSKHPKEAVEALRAMIGKIGHEEAERRLSTRGVGEVEMVIFRWPKGLQINDWLLPCFAALPGAFILGNNETFTEDVIRAHGAGGGGFQAQPRFLSIKRQLRDYGLSPESGLAGGLLLFPRVRESLDGPLRWVAAQMLDASFSGPALRAEIEREERRRGKSPTIEEVDKLFNAEKARRLGSQEESLQRAIKVLDWLTWGAFEVTKTPKGASVRAAVEFAGAEPRH